MTDFLFILQVYEREEGIGRFSETCRQSGSSLESPFETHSQNLFKGKRCPYCSYCTYSSHNLQRHIRFKHTGEKPFKCNICSKSFAANSDLQVHTRTHTGERPYKCEICSKTFTQFGNRATHMKTHF
ncbi:Zinc-responsive transcriptional regulator ZAP1 [Armadillidium vulgare]|nr:Zinc-responsive transcriptional regulator ZAP1 [Armadillidium vulgare]